MFVMQKLKGFNTVNGKRCCNIQEKATEEFGATVFQYRNW